jgi:hypothetical protein
MLLAKLQTLLGDLYALDQSYSVDDFVTSDAALAQSLDGGGRRIDEKLLIAEADGEADVALYLDHALLERLAARDPLESLTADNLGDFWAALEGVSHFTYYAWNAEREKSVTLFELELQAEVDKFVATDRLLREQHGQEPVSLHRWLFDLPTLDERLEGAELERYRRANRYAGKYCRKLAPALARDDDSAERDLRRFYRLSQTSKLAHIGV